jgi:hypothetical protein
MTPGGGRRSLARVWARLRSASSAQLSAGVGLVALLATLTYNGYGIGQQTRQSRLQVQQLRHQTAEERESRVATEVGLLSQLNQTFNELDQALAETRADDWLCDPQHGVRSLPRQDEIVLYRALDYYDWLAWLFNNDRIRYAPARDYWVAKMVDAERFGDWFFPEGLIAKDFGELVALRRRAVHGYRVCPAGG